MTEIRLSSQTRTFGDAVLVMLSGDCDFSNAQMIEELMLDAAASGATHLIVDLTQASLVDTSTVRALSLASARMGAAGGDVCLVDGPRLLRLLRIAGVAQAFTLADSLSEALRIVAARSRLAAADASRLRARERGTRFLDERWARASSSPKTPPLAAA
jgi:anti-anti-sigma factor